MYGKERVFFKLLYICKFKQLKLCIQYPHFTIVITRPQSKIHNQTARVVCGVWCSSALLCVTLRVHSIHPNSHVEPHSRQSPRRRDPEGVPRPSAWLPVRSHHVRGQILRAGRARVRAHRHAEGNCLPLSGCLQGRA